MKIQVDEPKKKPIYFYRPLNRLKYRLDWNRLKYRCTYSTIHLFFVNFLSLLIFSFTINCTYPPLSDLLGTVDFIDPSDGAVVFRTCPKERHKIILQIGTADPERALEAAKKVWVCHWFNMISECHSSTFSAFLVSLLQPPLCCHSFPLMLLGPSLVYHYWPFFPWSISLSWSLYLYSQICNTHYFSQYFHLRTFFSCIFLVTLVFGHSEL